MMASAESAAPTVSNTSNSVPASASGQKDGPSRLMKSNAGSKMTQKTRKESPSDTNRQAPTSKAWSGSTNPITQRASTPNSTKGPTSQNKNSPSTRMGQTKDQALSDKHNYDRLRFLFGGSVGLQVVLTTKNGDKYEGVFAGYSGSLNASKLTLKMTKKVAISPITQPNGMSSLEATFAGSSPDHAMTFELKDMADMTIPEFSLAESSRQTNGGIATFQTDADISGNTNRGERVLQRWVPEANDTADLSLESTSTAGWDQFATHEKMFGGQSTYSEETYTTAINRNAANYKQLEAVAARKAREIEAEASGNAHVREERGQALENDFGDEEDKYSGVRRDARNFQPLAPASANRYTPPALRAPSAQSSTTGVPVDPAIISSQIARSDSKQNLPAKVSAVSDDKTATQSRALSASQTQEDELPSTEKELDLSRLISTGDVSKPVQHKQMASVSPERQPDTEAASQGVEKKLLSDFRVFANTERARVTEKKRLAASQDRTAKINDLVRFSKTFKLKTPIPNDLVGILAKDPKKQEEIMEKAHRDHQDAKPSVPSTPASTTSSAQPTPIPKFDKSQIPPPIPDRNTFNVNRANYGKQSLPRGTRPLGQQPSFAGANASSIPRGPGSRNGHLPAPIPVPELMSNQSTAGNSGLSSPRGIDTPTSAVSTKFNVRALEFRPTAPAFNPSTASVSAASPSPITRTVSIARTASPSSFFGQRKPKKTSERLDVMTSFNPFGRMKDEVVKNNETKKPEEPVRDFASNGGIPNAFHTPPTWDVAKENKDKVYDDIFRPAPAVSPVQNRTGSHQAVPFHNQMQPMAGHHHIAQAVTPQHNHHGHQFPPHFNDQHMHMQNSSSAFASPNMTPRNGFASPMGHPAQAAYGYQSYFGSSGGPMPIRPYGNNPAMMHGQHMGAHMMVQQPSGSPYMGMQNQVGMVHPSPSPGYAYPQMQNGYPSPGRMAPVMMQQNSQQGYHGGPQMMYSSPGHGGAMYGQQGQMGRGYGGNTPYGTSPHQPQLMGQRAMSSGYVQKGVPQMNMNGAGAMNVPQQPAVYGQMPTSDEAK